MSEQQNQLDELRRAIRELPDENIIVTYDGAPLITVGTVHDLKALDVELTRVEEENRIGWEQADYHAVIGSELMQENRRLTARVEELEEASSYNGTVARKLGDRVVVLEAVVGTAAKAIHSFDLMGNGSTENLYQAENLLVAALESKEAGEENG